MKRFITLLSLTLFYQFSYCQVWERTYSHPWNVTVQQIKESYDNGYIIGSVISVGSFYKIGWIIKTDVNGNILWEKEFGTVSEGWGLWGFDNTPDGGIVVVGSTDSLNNSVSRVNPFVLKLDACANPEWCRIFLPGNENPNMGIKILSLTDNTVTALFYLKPNGQSYQSPWLYHLDETGSILWEQGYLQNDPQVTSYYARSLILTPENNYLITGTCYAPDSGQGNIFHPRPLLILADSSGEAMWEIPWMVNTTFTGEGFQSICSDNNIYSAISKYARDPDPTNSAPCMIKTSMQGIPLSYKKTVDPINFGKASTITKISDTVLFLGGTYSEGYSFTPNLSAFKVDTLGNVRKEKILCHSDWLPMDAILTKDNKYLITAKDEENNAYVIKLWKLNANLEFDSIYTRPFTYDSLCPYPITSSTLSFPCDVVTAVQEPAFNTERVKMLVYPNPGSEIITVRMPECIQKPSQTEHFNVITVFHKWTKDLQLQVFDLFGKLVDQKTIKPDEKEISLNVTSWNPGVYFFRLIYGDTMVASEKFVKD